MKIVFPSQKYISELKNVEIKQGEFSYSDPLVVPDKKWEGHRTHTYGSVIKTQDEYRMYYQCGNALIVSLATSKDGKVWEKPFTNKVEFDEKGMACIQAVDTIDEYKAPSIQDTPNAVDTNIVSTLHEPTVIYDKVGEYPYKMFGYGEEGFRVEFSKDGITFEDYEKNPVIPIMEFPNEISKKTWYSDVSPVFKDYHKKRYVAMTKTYHTDNEGRTRRCVGYSESKDFKEWSDVETVWIPDDSDDTLAKAKGYNWADFYGLCAFNYGDYYMGVLWLFNIESELPKGTHIGKMDAYLAYSEDGKCWQKAFDKPIIPYDMHGSDGGMITTASEPIFERDKIRLFYSNSNFLHGFREKEFTIEYDRPTFVTREATFRRDGFAYAYSQNGEIKTKLIDITCKRLFINIDASEGEARIYIMQGEKLKQAYNLKGLDVMMHNLNCTINGEVEFIIQLANARFYSLDIV